MTELERLLKSELDKRERYFLSELKKYTDSYEKNLELIQSKYQQIINDQKRVIDQQSQTLERYSNVTKSMQISIDEEQLRDLKSSHTKLMLRLDALEKQDEDLLTQLNEVLRKL